MAAMWSQWFSLGLVLLQQQQHTDPLPCWSGLTARTQMWRWFLNNGISWKSTVLPESVLQLLGTICWQVLAWIWRQGLTSWLWSPGPHASGRCRSTGPDSLCWALHVRCTAPYRLFSTFTRWVKKRKNEDSWKPTLCWTLQWHFADCSPGDNPKPIKKRTVLMTNAPAIQSKFRPLQCNCPRGSHQTIEGSIDGISLSKWCQHYTPQLCNTIADVVAETLLEVDWQPPPFISEPATFTTADTVVRKP